MVTDRLNRVQKGFDPTRETLYITKEKLHEATADIKDSK